MSKPAHPISWHLACNQTGDHYHGLELRYRREHGALLDVVHHLEQWQGRLSLDMFDKRLASKRPIDRSGVWRFRELILPLPDDALITKPEGNTNLYDVPAVARYVGLDALRLKHEGENPTGSFKDRGMVAAITMAKYMGMTRVACASTGNTSAAMASYAATAGMEAFVFIPDGKIAFGKLSQALAYGAKTIQIKGNFDDAMALVQAVCKRAGIYLLNSINPFRIEGQKAIGFELLQDLDWHIPDWIVLPGGNLGNNTAIAKGLMELKALGLIDRLPRIAVVQADGANPLYQAFSKGSRTLEPVVQPKTIASAIQIGNPVSWFRSLRGLEATDGIVTQVSDQEIMDAKAQVDAAGVGAEPASCATVAGLKRLVAEGVIRADESVCGILTGHVLKDPDNAVKYHRGTLDGIVSTYGNAPVPSESDVEAVLRVIEG